MKVNPPLPSASRLTVKNQITIPVLIRKQLGLKPRDHVDFVVDDTGVRITPSHSVAEMTAGIAGPQARPADLKKLRREFEEGIAEEVTRELEEQSRDRS